MLAEPYPSLFRTVWVPETQTLPTTATDVTRRTWLARCAGKCAELWPIQVWTRRFRAGLHIARAANLLYINVQYLVFRATNQRVGSSNLSGRAN